MLSIIVPVYNAESYLSRCIDSILSQRLASIEILLVDDGSTDQSGTICDKYAAKDNRIKVFHKTNGGVSSARNMGLNHASGEWIAFVDADDQLTNNALSEDVLEGDLILYPYLIQKNGDIVHASWKFTPALYSEAQSFLSRYIHEGTFRTVWSKLFRKKLIGKIRFDERISIGEDHLFLLEYLAHTRSISIADKPFYIYNEPVLPLAKKYQVKVEDSIYILSGLISVYRKLDIQSRPLEKDLFCDYKAFCQQDIYRNPSAWYGSTLVKQFYKDIRGKLPRGYRMRYNLLAVPFLMRLRNFIRKI